MICKLKHILAQSSEVKCLIKPESTTWSCKIVCRQEKCAEKQDVTEADRPIQLRNFNFSQADITSKNSIYLQSSDDTGQMSTYCKDLTMKSYPHININKLMRVSTRSRDSQVFKLKSHFIRNNKTNSAI